MLWLLARTRFGRSWRAFADDPATAALFGVDGRRLLAATFLLAGLLAGLAGWIVAVYYGNISHSMGAMLGLKALVAAVIGGIGSVPGAFLGGICVALIEARLVGLFRHHGARHRGVLAADRGVRAAARRAAGLRRAEAAGRVEHDPEKCAAVFGKDHAPPTTWSGMTISKNIPLPQRLNA